MISLDKLHLDTILVSACMESGRKSLDKKVSKILGVIKANRFSCEQLEELLERVERVNSRGSLDEEVNAVIDLIEIGCLSYEQTEELLEIVGANLKSAERVYLDLKFDGVWEMPLDEDDDGGRNGRNGMGGEKGVNGKSGRNGMGGIALMRFKSVGFETTRFEETGYCITEQPGAGHSGDGQLMLW